MDLRSTRMHHWWTRIGVAALTPAVLAGTAGSAFAQDTAAQLTARAYPVAIHAGTCNAIMADPLYDLGFAYLRPVLGIDDTDPTIVTVDEVYGTGDQTPLDENAALIYEDANNDGILDDDEDLDANGLFDIGFDLNQNEILDVDEVIGAPLVWSAVGDFADITGIGAVEGDVEDDIRLVPRAVVFHDQVITDQDYLACGEVAGAARNGAIVFPLRPVGENGMTGLAVIEASEGDVIDIGGDSRVFGIHAWPNRAPISPEAVLPPPTPTPVPPTPTPIPPTPTPVPPTPTPEPTATPVPTNTPVPTPTPIVIEVPTQFTIEFRETELFPQAFTALANTDTELILANLTTEPRTFFIDGLDVSQELPAGETVSITINAPVGEYQYGLVEDETMRGVMTVAE